MHLPPEANGDFETSSPMMTSFRPGGPPGLARPNASIIRSMILCGLMFPTYSRHSRDKRGRWSTEGAVIRLLPRDSPGVRRRKAARVPGDVPDLREEDIAGSGFAITGYTVHPDSAATPRGAHPPAAARSRPAVDARLRAEPHRAASSLDRRTTRLLCRELNLIWPQAPHNYTRVTLGDGERVLAFGRDPYFAGWPDTLQLELQQSGDAGGDARRAPGGSPGGATGSVRHGDAGPARRVRAYLGPSRPPCTDPPPKPQGSPRGSASSATVYWDLEWAHAESRDSTTPTKPCGRRR